MANELSWRESAGFLASNRDGPDHIGTVETFAATAIVALVVVVKLEGLPILQSQHAVDAPSILQFLSTAAHFRKLIGEVPAKTVRNVEIRRTVFVFRVVAVVGLGGVGLKSSPSLELSMERDQT